MTPGPWIHPTATIEEGATIGAGTSIWSQVHIRAGARIGDHCIVGEKTYVGIGVVVGSRVKINAFVFLCSGVTISDGVMVSAGTIFTNDLYPRATTADLSALLPSELPDGAPSTQLLEGASVGARCVVGPGVTIGRFAMVGMGSVVTRPIPDFHLALGQPARSVACVCRCGQPLVRFSDLECRRTTLDCSTCRRRYGVNRLEVSELGVEEPSASP